MNFIRQISRLAAFFFQKEASQSGYAGNQHEEKCSTGKPGALKNQAYGQGTEKNDQA
jgi:hypothetical protein